MRTVIRNYLYLWWNIRVWLCDVGGRIFGHSVFWCRIHGGVSGWRGEEPAWLERIFWHPVESKS